MTRKGILELLTAGQEVPDYTNEDIHLRNRVQAIASEFRGEYMKIAVEASNMVKRALMDCTTRKEFADFFLTSPHREVAPVAFKMLDHEDHKPLVWKIVKQRNKNVSDTETGEETDE